VYINNRTFNGFSAFNKGCSRSTVSAVSFRFRWQNRDRTPESFRVQNGIFIILLCKYLNYKSKGRPRERSNSACWSRIIRVVSLSEETLKNFTTKSGRIAKQSGSKDGSVVLAQYNNDTKRKSSAMSYYITKPCCCSICVELLISTVFCFTGSSFSFYENEDLRFSFSRLFVFVTPLRVVPLSLSPFFPRGFCSRHARRTKRKREATRRLTISAFQLHILKIVELQCAVTVQCTSWVFTGVFGRLED